MPPRKSVRRNNKPSTSNNAVVSPAPKAKTDTELPDDLKMAVVPEEVSDPIPVESGDSMTKAEVNEAKHEEECLKESEEGEKQVKEDLKESDEGEKQIEEDLKETVDADEEEPEEEEDEPEEEEPEEDDELEINNDNNNAELTSAQEETTAVQVVDVKQLSDNNNGVQDSDISKSPCKNDDPLVVNNGDLNDTTEMVSIQDDSMVNLDDDVSDDDEDNEADEDQDPSLIVQDSSPDNKKEKGMEIYVGKLDKNAVEEDLVNVFQQFGELKSTRIVRKPNTNKSKGFGFVRFASVDQANRALSELKDGVEVKGKRVVISASQDNDTLYLGNICKTWNNEQVLQQLKEYGVENIEVLRLPEDPKLERKNKGFAFLEFSSHSDAVEAFKRLKKPNVVFGRDVSAKVAFAESPKPSADEDLLQVNVVHLEGLTEDWTEEKVKDICKSYGEILKINVRPKTRNKRKDFGFVTFNSSESALACVEGINNTAIGVETKIKASIAKPQQKGGIHGGFKVEKLSENSNKKSQPKSSKMKGVVNTQQTKINKKHPLKNKPQQKGPLKKDGGSSKVAESSKTKGDNGSQHANRKRKASFEQKSNARDLGTPKKPKNGGQGPNSQSVSKAGNNKRKVPGNEAREDRGNRNAQGKKPFKKQKGNMYGRERDNYRKPKGDAYPRRGHDDYRNSTRYTDPYAPKYAASASNAYHVDSDRRYKEMEPHAGYIEPAAYSRYAQPIVQTHGQHQTVYHSQSQLYSRYLDRPVVTQPHRGYVEAQPYRDYRPSAVVPVARGPYDSGHARVVRHDDRGAGGLTYVGGPPHPASQVADHTSYYQASGSYSGSYGSRGAYY